MVAATSGVRELVPAVAAYAVSRVLPIKRNCCSQKSGGQPPHSKTYGHIGIRAERT
jgi:hypothetical protein